MGDSITIPTTSGGSATSTKVPVVSSIAYDSPFFDMTSFYMPKSIKGMFRYIHAVLYGDPIVSQTISKLSEYPITRINYTNEKDSIDSESIEKRWKTILEDKMNIIDSMKVCGMDYYGYGTSLVSINYPFKRMLTCKKCGNTQTVDSAKTKYKSGKFYSTCNKCKRNGDMKAKDVSTKEISKLSFIFWDLMNIHIKYNNISGDHFFYYTIPGNIKKAVKSGDMDIINTTRLEVIHAVYKNKKIKLSKENLFHYKRPGPQYLYPEQRGWGIPATMPVLKDIFYKRLLRKGNEAIAFEHIVPLRIIFPQGTGDVSPHSTINLGSWKGKIEAEILKWKRDPNRISIVPLPVGQLNFGGDGKMLLVTNEIKQVDEDIMIGIGVIPEIIKGGASWSGSNVSLRVVENTFLNHRKSMQGFIDWTVGKISKYLGIAEVSAKMEDFKMADDVQRKSMLMNAAANGQISFETALKELELNPDAEYKQMIDEIKRQTEILTLKAEGQAESQGAAQVISSLYGADSQFEAQSRMQMHQRKQNVKDEEMRAKDIQARSQAAVQEATELSKDQNIDPADISLPNLIMILSRRFAKLSKNDPEEFKIRMISMKNTMPNMYQEVYNNLSEMNVIVADLLPDLAVAQKDTPGEIPTFNQGGDKTSISEPSPAEKGPDLDKVNGGAAKPNPVKPLPIHNPPRGVNTSI